MNPLPRLSALGPRTKIALGALALLLLLAAVFDWNWLRPALVRHLSQASGRKVQLADLHLGLDSHLQPVVRLRGVRVQNAAWASPQPFAVAGEARFTFSWASLFQDVRVITHMELVDADVSLERQADGLRNWRLTRPDDRGPGRMRVLSLQTLRSQIHVVHQGVGLSMQAASTPLPQADGEFTQRITFSGHLRGAPFAGEALAGPVLSLQHTGNFFSLRGQARSAQTQLQVDGQVADLMHLDGLDAQLQLRGPSLAQLKPFFPTQAWPPSQPYQAEARVTRHGDTFTARSLQARLGGSDLAGEMRYDKNDDRPRLQATLRSERIDLHDVPRPAPPASAASSQRVLPQTALDLAALNDLDATVDLNVKALLASPVPALSGLRVRATLDRGLLQLALQDASFAGGHLSGQFALDNRPASPGVNAELRARNLRLEQLVQDLPGRARVEGPLNGVRWPPGWAAPTASLGSPPKGAT